MLKTFFRKKAANPNIRHRLYAIGDIHGHAEELDKLLTLIFNDVRQSPNTEATIVFLADYVNRGPNSKAVMDRLVKLDQKRPHGIKPIFLLGNHDIAFRGFVEAPPSAQNYSLDRSFLRAGGATTCASYGVFFHRGARKYESDRPWSWLTQDEMTRAKISMRQNVPTAHLDLIRNAKTHIFIKPESFDVGYFLCHGGVTPVANLNEQPEDVLIGTDYDAEFSRDFARHYKGTPLLDKDGQPWVVIHGHTPIGWNPKLADGRISVDTLCYGGGNLSCAVIADGLFEKSFKVPSLYKSFNENLIPSNENWPPQKGRISMFDRTLKTLVFMIK